MDAPNVVAYCSRRSLCEGFQLNASTSNVTMKSSLKSNFNEPNLTPITCPKVYCLLLRPLCFRSQREPHMERQRKSPLLLRCELKLFRLVFTNTILEHLQWYNDGCEFESRAKTSHPIIKMGVALLQRVLDFNPSPF